MSTIKSSDEHLTINADGSGKDIKLQNNGSESVAITSTGVGIGTDNPASKLHIYAASSDNLLFGGKINASDGGAIRSMDSTASNFKALELLSAETRIGGQNSIRFGTSGTGGTTERMRIDSDGAITMPSQPAFSAYMNVGQSNIPTGYSVISFSAERFDQGGDYNTSTYEFTAPVSGKYLLSTTVSYNSLPLNAQWFFVQIDTSNAVYSSSTSLDQYDATTDSSHATARGLTTLADMDAGDVARVRVYQFTGSVYTDLKTTAAYTFFSGHLVC